ncbi:hypothetical protein M3O96_15755 [Aquiflexum sp. TKW24L]|uniref:hypothetical protein n=1 Tax=Aquiflexum sp. TKW24L TaxID=2942212 RepID=UPI0020BE440B|nr:hypothetical protein [Aquiflexum sp. TKW24L]MCL6260558.1 hypothetical protein [Aquiflexum sp. TKW24L]
MSFMFFFLVFNFFTANEVAETYVVKEKRISVKGKTSLGGFTCKYSEKGLKESLVMNSQNGLPDLDLNIIVENFGCGNFILNKDFRNTIKAKEFPMAKVRVNNWVRKNGRFYCNMFVTLAGKHLVFRDLELVRVKEGVKANVKIQFSQLGLAPPSKMGGMVKVDENLDLEIVLAYSVR